MSVPVCLHIYRDGIVGCEDCGEHPAVLCDSELCTCEYGIDLIYEDDPRDLVFTAERAAELAVSDDQDLSEELAWQQMEDADGYGD